MLYFQRVQSDLLEAAAVFPEIRGLEGLAVAGVKHGGRFLQDRVPGLPILLRVFDPDDRPASAGKAVHGRVAAEELVAREQRDVIRRVPRGLEDLIGEAERAEAVGADGDQPVQKRVPDGRIAMLAVAEQGQNLTEEPGRVRGGAAALKGVLPALQARDGPGVQKHLRVRRGQDLVEKARVVVMGVGEKNEFDLFRVDIVLPEHLQKMREAPVVPGVNEDIAEVGGDQIIVDDPAAEIADHGFPPC